MRRRPSKTVRWLLAAFLGGSAVFMGAVIVYAFSSLRALARQTSCLGNINQVGLSVRMYAQDYDDHLPPFTQWVDKAYPYCKTWAVYRCPEVPESAGFGYGLNNETTMLSKIVHPETYPLVFESRDLQKNSSGPFLSTVVDPPRHLRGGYWVLYADGRPKLFHNEKK